LFDYLLGEEVEEPGEDGVMDRTALFESIEEVLYKA
jgi:hypothetical protein